MPNASSTLASKLVLSDNASVEAVLTEIPFFTVGVVAFLLSTFFLVMRRFNLLALYLQSSALFAFGAVTLDLSQVLARSNVSDAIDGNGLNAIVNTREVGLSLALGFRFLFYWTYVSQRPRGEADSVRQGIAYNLHSGDWRRWGYVGIFLQWSLLALVISIPILEMVWRIVSRHFNTVYMTSTTIAIVAAALFTLKLFLNVFLSPVSARLLSRWYSVPVIALLINMGISVGNLISFVFSETTLGRFLQAIELYLLMLFLLISTFYRNPQSDTLGAPSTQLNKMPVFDEKTTGTGYKSESRPGVVVGTPTRPFDLRMSRASSWLFGRAPTRRSVSQGWGRGDIEQGGGSTVSAPDDTSEIKFANTVKKQVEGVSEPPPVTASPSMKAILQPRPFTEVTLASYYEMDQDNRLSFPTAVKMTDAARNGSDSPVYGLDGIIRPSSVRSSKQISLKGRASMSSFDELLRQQGELDKSIATLRLFSPQASEPVPVIPKVPSPPPSKRQSSRVISNSTNSWGGRGLDSASARSEFSLSVFPEPPKTGEPVPVPDKENRTDGIRGTVDEFPSMPTSPHQYNTGRFASNGTQYDVTSFIGDLTVIPIDEKANRMNSLRQTDDVGTPELSLASATSAPSLGPATASSGLLTGMSSSDNIPRRRTSTVPAISSPLANPFPPRNPMTVPVGPRPAMSRGRSPSMTRPGVRLNISGPRPQASVDQTPGAFERPRPPPLAGKT